LLEIIENRIEFAPEINGVINTSYVSMDEHLVGYWCNSFVTPIKMRDGSVGTRKDIQIQLVSFLHSLKYFSARWLRAKTYAELAGFLTISDHLKVNSEIPVKTTLPPESILIDDHQLGNTEIK
jgi:hypothetical protein